MARVNPYLTESEIRANDEQMVKEFDEWRRANPPTFQPFRLTYMAYAKSVWELGLYEKIPPLLKRIEPVPFTNEVPEMVALREDSLEPPPFKKEYFHNIKKKQSRHLSFFYKHFTGPGNVKRIPAQCNICFIKRYYPNIEKHFPRPFPDTYCAFLGIRNFHFRQYIEQAEKELEEELNYGHTTVH